LSTVILGNVLGVLASNYFLLATARVISGGGQGLFMAMVIAYAVQLVPPHQIGRAIAVTGGAGGIAALTFGVPLVVAAGQAHGWRIALVAVSAALIVLLMVTIRWLPQVETIPWGVQRESPVRSGRDWSFSGMVVSYILGFIVMGGSQIAYTFIVPYLLDDVGITPGGIAPTLLLSGIASAAGLLAAGATTDRYPRLSFATGAVVMAGSLLAIALFPGTTWLVLIGIAGWGAAFGALPPMVQTRLMKTTPLRLRPTASAMSTTSFNLGHSAGALIGGLMLAQGVSMGALPLLGAVSIVFAIAIAIIGDARIGDQK
jgi:predicted MFS family arabinose efflux permease